MKSFIEIITEAKDRFIRKSKVLSKDEQDAVIKWIEKYKNFEDIINKEIGWNKVHKVSFDTLTDYLAIATDTKSAKKKQAKKLRHKGIKGLKEGEDYINVKTKNPYYLTYIPLHYGAAQVIKTSHIGGCTHDGCIGSTQASLYFKQEGKKKGRVAVYVIGMGEKYVVMMYPDGRHETWRKENERGESGEIIPNFSIKKELATSKLKELYKDILSNKSSGTYTEDEYNDAESAYDSMADMIETYFSDRIQAKEDHDEHNESVYKEAVRYYTEEVNRLERKMEDILNPSKNSVKLKMAEIKRVIEVEPTGTGTNSRGEVVWNLRGIDYTMDELLKIFKDSKKDSNRYEKESREKYDEMKKTYDVYVRILNELEDFEDGGYDFEEYASDMSDFPIFDDVYTEDYMFDGLYSYIDFDRSDFDDYFEFAESYLGVDEDRRYLAYHIYEDDSEIIWGGDVPDGREMLAEIDLPHPSMAEEQS